MPTIDPPTQKLTIYSLEGPRVVVAAMFNPKDIQIEQSVRWTRPAGPAASHSALEFSFVEARVMSFEVLFDGFETGTNVHSTFVEPLARLTGVQDPNGAEDRRRPPRIGVRWGVGKLPEFLGVIETLSTKYTMFLPDGTPVRATCRLAIKEASQLSVGAS